MPHIAHLALPTRALLPLHAGPGGPRHQTRKIPLLARRAARSVPREPLIHKPTPSPFFRGEARGKDEVVLDALDAAPERVARGGRRKRRVDGIEHGVDAGVERNDHTGQIKHV